MVKNCVEFICVNIIYCTVLTGTYSPGRKSGLRIFKPIAQRLLKMRKKQEAENSNVGNWNSFAIQFEFGVCAYARLYAANERNWIQPILYLHLTI